MMYVNFNNPRFSPHHNYAFLRHHSDTTLVVAVNFSDKPVQLQINIPQLAFDMMHIEPGKRMATELISGRRQAKTLSADTPFETQLAPCGGMETQMTSGKSTFFTYVEKKIASIAPNCKIIINFVQPFIFTKAIYESQSTTYQSVCRHQIAVYGRRDMQAPRY